MRALWFERGRVDYRADVPAPETRAGECRVRVLRAGVCATDLALLAGYMGFRGVPGHEFVGIALEGRWAGRRIVGEINAACGSCATCRAGLPGHCSERTVLGILARPGAFADELSLPEANLHVVPDDVSTDAATFCEPLAAAFEIAEQLDLSRFERALVVGDGRLGLLCAQVLALATLEVRVAGRHRTRFERLAAGARRAGQALGRRNLAWAEPADLRPRSFDLAVDATGDPAALSRIFGLLRPRATLVLKTTSERTAAVDLAPLVIDEITLVGSRCGPFPRALAALARGEVAVAALIAERYPLADGALALARASTRGVLKVLLDVAPPGE